MQKKALTILLILMLVTTLTLIGVTFAYYRQYSEGWPQTISATSVVFKLNGKSVNTVTNYDLGLISRGKEAELDFEVSIKASDTKSSVASFDLAISFDAANTDGNELARAIEVYQYTDGKYGYIGMLNEMKSITGTLTVNTEKNFYYKFVYSEASSSYFDGKSFSLILDASSGVNSGESNYYFASSFEGLKRASEAGVALSGKTIVLTNNVSITTANENGGVIDFAYPISLDLNGKTLNLGAGTALNFNYSTAGKPAILDGNPASTGEIVGGGRINYTCPADAAQADFVFIQDSLSDSYPRITVTNAAFSAISAELQRQLDDISSGVLILGDSVDFTDNLKYYFSASYTAGTYAITPPQLNSADDETVIVRTDSTRTAYIVNPAYNEELTQIHRINFALAYSGGSSSVLTSRLTVRGTSIQAVATTLLDRIPGTINGSIFLAGHDAESNSTITWISSNDVLSKDGVYLPDGYESLSSWTDTTVKLGIIVNCAGVSYSLSKDVTVRILSPKQRTDLIYGYQQIIVDELGSVTDILTEYVNATDAVRAGLTDIEITIDETQNKNDLNESYLQVIAGTTTDMTSSIKVLHKPSVGNSALVDVTLRFVYADVNIAGETVYSYYSVPKTVTIVGFTDSADLSDPTSTLQQVFDANVYTDGTGYVFNALGYTSQGTNVDYFVAAPYSDYVFVQNGVYTSDANGVFALINGAYVFFDATYSLDPTTHEYISALNGDYIFVNGAYVSIAAQRAAGQIYRRESVITVLPSRVPAVLETDAVVTAKIWDETANGEPQYLTNSDTGEVLEYTFTLTVKGIYHNSQDQIEEYALYSVLLEYFDLNANGWIEVGEAQTKWFSDATPSVQQLATALSTKTVSGKEYYYIDFSNLSVSSLKGLEYFTGALGFNLGGNDVIGISQLNALYSLNYVDLSNNLVSDISYLSYLDGIEVLNLSGDPITSLQPLQYLPAVRSIDLKNCNYLTNYEYLEDYSELRYADIRQTGNAASLSKETKYYLALIYDANRSHGVTIYNGTVAAGTPTAYVPSDTEIVAAKVLSEMVCVHEVYTTLNLPNYYYYEFTVGSNVYRKTYNVKWLTANETNLVFSTDANGKTTGYTITTPIVNKNVKVIVSVTDTADTSSAVAVDRTFTLTLLQSQAQSDIAYIQTATGVQLATDVVPDTTLLNILFNSFNTVTNGTVTVEGTVYNEKYIITHSELNPGTLSVTSLDTALNGAGITSLTGLRHFANCIGVGLDLRGNTVDGASIGELSYMLNVPYIKLNGSDYDFSMISSYIDGSPATVTGLTQLQALYVYGCIGLESDAALNELYQVYLANPSVSVYKDSDVTAWDPYEILPKYAQSLPSAFVFINLNDTAEYFAAGANTQIYNFYGVKDISFALSLNNDNLSGKFKGAFTHTANGVTYRTLAGYSDTVYDKTVLTGNDGSGRGDITADHYVELKIDFNYHIFVTDYPLSSSNVGLETVFPGRDLRAAVLSKLSALFAGGTGVGYTQSGSYYYIRLATLLALDFSNYTESNPLTIDGTYSDTGDNVLQGLQYTSCRHVKIERDAYLGDGTYLSGLETLAIAYSGVDFSTITVELPNMRKMWIGVTSDMKKYENNRYAVLYDDSGATPVYSLAHFTGLTDFILLGSNCYNWRGLNGLVGINVQKLYIYGTSGDWSNKNNNSSSTEAIVDLIYSGSNAGSKDFRIGTAANATDSSTKFTGGTGTTQSGVTSLVTDPVKEYGDFASQIADLSVKLNGTLHYLVSDAEVADGGTITLPSSTYGTYGVTNGLGASAFGRRFAVQWRLYGLTAADAAALFGLTGLTGGTDNGMSYVNVPNNANGRMDVTLTVSSRAYDFYFIAVGTIGGAYIAADGTSYANGGYFDEEGAFNQFASAVTAYSFGYPVLLTGTAASSSKTVNVAYSNTQNGAQAGTVAVTSSDFYQTTVNGKTVTYLSYGAIKSAGLRFRLFAHFAAQATMCASAGYDLNGIMFYHSSDDYLGAAKITYLSGTSTADTFNYADGSSSTVTLSSFGKNLTQAAVDTLDGLDYLLSLGYLNYTSNDIRDVSALGALAAVEDKHLIYNGTSTVKAGLDEIYLSGNLVTDISALKDFDSLVTVNLAKNPVRKLTYTSGANEVYVFTASVGTMTTLRLDSCKFLTSADVAAMETAYVAGTNRPLATLTLYDTGAVYGTDTLLSLGEIAASVSGTLNVGYTSATASAFTKTGVTNFFNDVATDTTTAGYTAANGGYPLFYDFASSLTISGRQYSLSLLSGGYLLENGKGAIRYLTTLGTTTATLRIVLNGTQYAAEYEIDVFDTDNGTLERNDSSAPIAIYNNTASFHYANEFDPVLWQYLVNNSTFTTGATDYFNYSPGGENATTRLTLSVGTGMKSLKGINLLTSLQTLTVGSVSSDNRSLTSLWEGTFSSLTSLTLINTGVTEEGLTALRYTPNLTSLDLAETERIDYLRTFTYTFNAASYTSNAANIILDFCPSLTKIYINTLLNPTFYGGATPLAEYISAVNNNSYLFGILPAANANAKRLKAFSDGVSVTTATTVSAGTAMRRKLSDFNYSKSATAQFVLLNAQTNTQEVNGNAVNVSEFETALDRAALTATSDSRSILPANIYQSDIQSTGVLFYLPETVNVNDTALTYSWSIKEGPAAYLNGSVFYADRSNYDADQTTIVLSFKLKNGNVTVDSGEKTITVVTSSIADVSSSAKLPTYYVEVLGDNGKTVLRPATDYFKSSRLLYFFFNDFFNSAVQQVTLANYQDFGVPASSIGSYYLSYATIMATTSITFKNEGITTLAGLELFANLQSFTLTSSAIVSIEQLSNMHLTSFEYSNSSDSNRNFLVLDFTPLLNSKDTLTTFKYHTGGYVVNIDDLSILKEFGEQLTTITIGPAASNKIEGYNHTASFKELVNWFAVNRQDTTITYNGVNVTSSMADSDWQRASEIFGSMSFTGSGVSRQGESLLTLSTAATTSAGVTTAYLPTHINRGGNYYMVDWNTLSAFVTLSPLTYRGTTFSHTFTGELSASTISDGTTLTEIKYAELLENRDFLQLIINGTGRVEQYLTLSGKSYNLSAFSYLLARITVDGFDFERSYILDYSDNQVYRQIALPSGVGHFYLPTSKDGAACSWYIADSFGDAVPANNAGLATYNGVTVRTTEYAAANGNVTRSLLVINEPRAATSGEITLLCRVGTTDTEYRLYFDFTALDKTSAQNATSPTVNQRDYLIALNTADPQTIIARYRNSLDALYLTATASYNAGQMSAAVYTSVTSAYATATAILETETDPDRALAAYNVAATAIGNARLQYRLQYNTLTDGTGDAFASTAMAEEGSTVTLPTAGTYTLVDEDGNNVIAWFVNGIRYEFGATFTMPSNDVIVAPLFFEFDYYLVFDGQEANYATTGYKLFEGTGGVAGTDYYYDHLIVTDKMLDDNYDSAAKTATFKIVRVPYASTDATGTSIVTVASNTISTEIKAIKLRTDNSTTENVQTGIGDYSFFFNVGNATLTYEKENFFFTLSTALTKGLQLIKDNEYAATDNVLWSKPDLNYMMNYSRELGVYYLTVTTASGVSNSGGFKVCGYRAATLATLGTSEPAGNGVNFCLSNGIGTDDNIGDNLGGSTLYTLYFTPDASVFSNTLVNYGGTQVGFTNTPDTGTSVGAINYATKGVVMIRGTYEQTKNLVTRSTATV